MDENKRGQAIHLNKGGGKPACGYHRWSSERFTTTNSKEKVTCKRKGCSK